MQMLVDEGLDEVVAVVMFLGAVVGIFVGAFAVYDKYKNPEIPEEIEGDYYEVFTAVVADVKVEVTAVVTDGQVKRTSNIKLTAKDFEESEIAATNKTFTKMVKTMLDNRRAEIDSLIEKNKKLDKYKGCELRSNGTKKYWVCPVD